MTKTCSNKDQCCHKDGPELDRSEFVKRKASKDSLEFRCKVCKKDYRENNKEKLAENRQDNKEKITLTTRLWQQNNTDKVNAHAAKRRSAKLQRTPSWANLETIKQIYLDCVEINLTAKAAGCTEKFVVDHLIPLQGENVSGLHVENNLQIITATENCSKSNKF